jgi:hypothetical protein
MGRKPKMIFDFLELSVMDKILFYRKVLAQLRANKDTFMHPDKDLAAVEGLVNTLETKYIAAASGFYAPTVAMHTAEGFADDAFRTLAGYVNRIAQGDESIIQLSGFTLVIQAQTPKQINVKEKGEASQLELKVKNGENPGSVELWANAVEHARAYIWQYVKDMLPANDNEWNTGYSTRLRYEVNELAIGTGYYFRVAAITPDGATEFTKAVSLVIK